MTRSAKRFLSAEWRHLAMLNYEVDPRLLQPLLPAGTELDTHAGLTFMSIVGFLFLDTRVLGLPIPFHRDFEEVNLRFYVRRKADDGWRRAVVFVNEIVPRRAIAWVARALYGERYRALPMAHALEFGSDGELRRAAYSFWTDADENRIEVELEGAAQELSGGSHEEFIAEHYWGYARRRDGSTLEYRVEHPPWRVTGARSARFECDVAACYGASFVESLSAKPASAFVAEGSAVTVFKGAVLT